MCILFISPPSYLLLLLLLLPRCTVHVCAHSIFNIQSRWPYLCLLNRFLISISMGAKLFLLCGVPPPFGSLFFLFNILFFNLLANNKTFTVPLKETALDSLRESMLVVFTMLPGNQQCQHVLLRAASSCTHHHSLTNLVKRHHGTVVLAHSHWKQGVLSRVGQRLHHKRDRRCKGLGEGKRRKVEESGGK